MEGWVLAGVILGLVIGFISGASVSFGYISYRSYKNYRQLQSDFAKAYQQDYNVANNGMSA